MKIVSIGISQTLQAPHWSQQPDPPDGTEGTAWGPYDVSEMVSGKPYTWGLVGSWPNGLSISQGLAGDGGGIVSGTPTTIGDHTGLQIAAENEIGETLNGQTFTITITAVGQAPQFTLQPTAVSVEV